MAIQKTDTARSPLLTPVIERNYTKGLDLNDGQTSAPPPPRPETSGTTQPPPPPPKPGNNFNPPPLDDFTKPFSFDAEIEDPSDIGEDGVGPDISMPAGSAKAFANFAGDALQIYLPKLTYNYVKIDIDNVIFNVNQGKLQNKWIDAFTKINENSEEGLKIPDDSIKMWKKAFKEYLEYKNLAFGNPETAFYAATIMLLVDQGVRAYAMRKQNEKFMKEALEQSDPTQFTKTFKGKETTEKPQTNDTKEAA